MLKNDVLISEIGQAGFDLFNFKVDIPRSTKIGVSYMSAWKMKSNRIYDAINNVFVIKL